MKAPLAGPGNRYALQVDVLACSAGSAFNRHLIDQGLLLSDQEPTRSFQQDGSTSIPRYLVEVDSLFSMLLVLGENGITVRSVKLMGAREIIARASVSAGGRAPEWLPNQSSYLLFEGDRTAAGAFRERFIPFEGMSAERSWSDQSTPLDRLAVAVGRSVTRANAALAATQSEAGVAMLSSVTIRMALGRTDLGQGRLLVSLAESDENDSGQFVELTMTTVPPIEGD